MSFSYGFFNAQNLDRVYTAEDFTAYLSSLICNGILDTYRQCFAPTIKNLSVTFGTGKAWIDGHYFISDTLHIIDLSSYVIVPLVPVGFVFWQVQQPQVQPFPPLPTTM